MYVPGFNAMGDEDEMRAFVDAHHVAQIVTVGGDGRPDASLVPIVWRGDTVVAHLARANEHRRRITDGAPALVIVTGADAYISPAWYEAKAETGKVVPTWNYSVVQLTGSIRVVDDPDWVGDVVRRLTDRHEARQEVPWSIDDAPAPYVRSMLRAIVGIEVVVDRVEGKAKLSQNRSDVDRATVIDGLRATGEAGPSAVADDMARRG